MFTGDVESAQQPSIAFKNVPLPTSLLKYIFCAAQTFSATNVLSGPIGALVQPPQTIDDEVDIVDRKRDGASAFRPWFTARLTHARVLSICVTHLCLKSWFAVVGIAPHVNP